MDLIELSTTDTAEGFNSYYQHIPGRVAPPYTFSVKDEENSYQAYLIYPFGQNPKNTTPILAWIQEGDKIYSPENFFNNKLGNLWKFEQQTYRFFTLFNNFESKKVRLNRSISKEAKDDFPLACFKEDGTTERPFTYINKETIYANFIYNISVGNLMEVINLLKDNQEKIKEAYPCLSTTILNIQKVHDDLKALEWFNENKINTIDDILAQKTNLSSFEQVSTFFQKLFDKKSKEDEYKYSKGILAIISKSFAYIPRE